MGTNLEDRVLLWLAKNPLRGKPGPKSKVTEESTHEQIARYFLEGLSPRGILEALTTNTGDILDLKWVVEEFYRLYQESKSTRDKMEILDRITKLNKIAAIQYRDLASELEYVLDRQDRIPENTPLGEADDALTDPFVHN